MHVPVAVRIRFLNILVSYTGQQELKRSSWPNAPSTKMHSHLLLQKLNF